jgi:hypothetical protein
MVDFRETRRHKSIGRESFVHLAIMYKAIDFVKKIQLTTKGSLHEHSGGISSAIDSARQNLTERLSYS